MGRLKGIGAGFDGAAQCHLGLLGGRSCGAGALARGCREARRHLARLRLHRGGRLGSWCRQPSRLALTLLLSVPEVESAGQAFVYYGQERLHGIGIVLVGFHSQLQHTQRQQSISDSASRSMYTVSEKKAQAVPKFVPRK